MSTEEIRKAIQELKKNHKTSIELYELNKKELNTNWVTNSKLLVRSLVLIPSSLTPLQDFTTNANHMESCMSTTPTQPLPSLLSLKRNA